MKLFELFEDSRSENESMKLKLSGIVNQIASSYIDTGAKKPMSLTSLIDKLNHAGFSFSEKQMREMVKNPPLSNTIASIAGDKVVFLGQDGESSEAIKPDQSTATLEKMAKRAEKKRNK
jgi:hypothetical protein